MSTFDLVIEDFPLSVHMAEEPERRPELKVEWLEKFDASKLKYIIDHLEAYKEKIITTGHDFKDDNAKWQQQHTQLSRYLAASKNGVIEVKYHQTKPNFGRLFANRSQSLQGITRAVRHSIAGEFYTDVDLKNAHPTILAHICRQANIKSPCLDYYIANRDQYLGKIMDECKIARGDAKQLFLAIMNGGSADYNRLEHKPQVLTWFKNECAAIWEKLIGMNYKAYLESKEARIKAGKDYNHDGSFANKMLCDFENRILAVMVDFFQREGLITDTCVLCFDGVMVPKNPRADYGILLPACCAAIEKALGIKVGLECKPMAEGLELPADIAEYKDPSFEFFADHNQFAMQEVSTKTLDKWIKSALVFITGGGQSSYYTKNRKRDPETKEDVTYFEATTTRGMMDTLKMEVKIVNPDYNPVIGGALAKMVKEGEKVPKEMRTPESNQYLEMKYLSDYVTQQQERRLLTVKNDINFWPYLKRLHPKGVDLGDTFNIFTGFPLDGQTFNRPQTFKESRLYAHMRDEIFNGDLGELDHFLDFAADIIQQPAKLRPVAHVFCSEQGCGKGMIVEWLKTMLGDEHVIVFASASAYFQKFNADRANKLLNVMEEVNERGECYEKHGQLKADITNPRIRIEFKGGAITHMNAFARFIFNSNNENTLMVEHDDRRLTMHRCSARYADNREYFGPIWAEVRSKDFALMSFDYLASRQYSVENVCKAYTTAYKQEQQLSNLSNVIKFLIQTIEHGWGGIEREGDQVSAQSMFDAYGLWCGATRVKAFAQPTFISELKRLKIEAPQPSPILGTTRLCLVINEPQVLATLRGYLRNPAFDFTRV